MTTNSTTHARSDRMSDDALRVKTGRDWQEWFTLLDEAGALKMGHPEIARYLDDQHGIPGWWAQTITVGYEQERGLRQKHETPDGYAISGSKTVPVALPELYEAWADPARRERWLDDPSFTVRRQTENKSMRITWVDGQTSVEVNFYERGPQKSQVALQHSKLPDPAQAEKMKAYWKAALARLADSLTA